MAATVGWHGVLMLYLESFIEPFGTLWFIYLLPIFFVVTRISRSVPSLAIWLVAAALEMMHVQTGWTVIDEFCARFVYFYSGYLFAAPVFGLAVSANKNGAVASLGILTWSVVNYSAVKAGISEWPIISLILGFAGAGAIITLGTILSRSHGFRFLRYCGEHSIVIYLSFFLPMAASRVLLLRSDVVSSIGAISLIVNIAGVAGALLMWWTARRVGAEFLYKRPMVFRLKPKGTPVAAMQPAE